MNTETLAALDVLFSKHPVMKAGPVAQSEVDAASANFRFPLPEDYKTFLATYGGAIVGPYPIYGLRGVAPMGNKETSALDITQRFIKQRWPGVESWLVISTDLSGNPIGLAADGQIWISDHDNGQITIVASSFEDFIRKWCLKL